MVKKRVNEVILCHIAIFLGGWLSHYVCVNGSICSWVVQSHPAGCAWGIGGGGI